MTQARERTTIGEALAVGCLATGVSAMTANKMTVETAFRRAWRDWPGASLFKSIRADLARNDITTILYDSERRRTPHIAAWSTEDRGWWTPYLTVEWDMQEAVESIEETSEMSWHSWESLTKAFLDYFKDDELRRDADWRS
ncbi:hypothetical protein Rhow_008494 [Rhodococcus wratislaviensis]|uniref:Uncharacterized protein n=2 Tax=Rhodococcus wratislaviensis TaxID=44752 RepID=A0A402CKM3_RHOWR|nr:hypothetical protein Rhow_008494 [Rhodococcus wratislaviensis]